MIDREKVIQGLECCVGDKSCTQCPYYDEPYCRRAIEHDALMYVLSQDLLKEQKSAPPVELPVQECKLCKCDLKDGDYLYQFSSQDNTMVFREIIVHYCPVCGRKL